MIVRDTGRPFQACSEGLHDAVCVDVVDVGVIRTKFGDAQKMRLVWETSELGDDGRYLIAAKLYTPSLNEKATLRKDLKAWRGKDFTADELQGFDTESLIGQSCQILVVHNEKDGVVYANVQSVLKPKMDKRPSGEYIRVKDREPKEKRDNGEIPF